MTQDTHTQFYIYESNSIYVNQSQYVPAVTDFIAFQQNVLQFGLILFYVPQKSNIFLKAWFNFEIIWFYNIFYSTFYHWAALQLTKTFLNPNLIWT